MWNRANRCGIREYLYAMDRRSVWKHRHAQAAHRPGMMLAAAFLLAVGTLAGCSLSLGNGSSAENTLENAEAANHAGSAFGDNSGIENENSGLATAENLIAVGVSQVGSESVFRTANTESLQRTFTRDNGYFLIFDNARQKQENQIKALRNFISQRVDYIVLSPLTEDGWDTVLLEAKEAGIPVILIDRRVDVEDESLYTAWVGSDFYQEGREAGRILEETLSRENRDEETIRIVVLRGTDGSTAEIGRSRGFEEIAEQHENWLVLESADAEFTTAKGKEVMARMLKQYSDINVVISQNDDMTFGALEAMQEAGVTAGEKGDIRVISFDATRSALELVKEGVLTADIECNPDQGVYVDELIRKMRNGKPAPKLTFVPETVYTKKNVAEALENRAY